MLLVKRYLGWVAMSPNGPLRHVALKRLPVAFGAKRTFSGRGCGALLTLSLRLLFACEPELD